jgi:mitochondrial fission protein ELM1
MNELEDQKNTQQELQTVLNNRLNGTIVALWTAISCNPYIDWLFFDNNPPVCCMFSRH